MKTCKQCGDGTQPGNELCDGCSKSREEWRAPADNSRQSPRTRRRFR